MRHASFRLVAVTVMAIAFAAVGVAHANADTATVAAGTGLPWTDPADSGPLETLLSSVSSTIAARSVGVHCDDDNAWVVLTQNAPFSLAGFVTGFRYYTDGRIGVWAPHSDISPATCLALQEYAQAEIKPTKCVETVTTQHTRTEWRMVPVRVRNQVWKVVAGRRVKVWVTQTRRVRKQVNVSYTTTETRGPSPCYTPAGRLLAADVASYERYAFPLWTIAHEAEHLAGVVGGTLTNGVAYGYPDKEARADCFGLQWTADVAIALGATPDDAASIARYDYQRIYPRRATPNPDYWSPECKRDGGLDLHRPAVNIWD